MGDATSTHRVEPTALDEFRTRSDAFLAKERRQVWALHCETGEPFYLDVGAADAQREFAKAHLRCPYPGCEAAISTRGGSKRDHFFHVSTAPHETGPESEFHLASKAMIAQWLTSHIPPGATVREEQTIKDPETAIHRRPDVLVTGQSGRRVAFEVEYKGWSIEGWEAKQADLDAQEIPTLWLIGHTRVNLVKQPEGALVGEFTPVRVPLFAAAMTERGVPLLVINPVTREVGTLVGDVHGTNGYRGYDRDAYLAVDSLDDCVWDRHVGLVTPTMRRIREQEEAERRQPAERAERERQARLAHQARLQVKAQREDRQRATWEATPLHASMVERWGQIPIELEVETTSSWAVWADRAHWHAVLYEELLHGKTGDFRWRDVFASLDRHGIRRHRNAQHVYRALEAWLDHLARLGLLRIHRDRNDVILLFSPTGATLRHIRQVEAASSPALIESNTGAEAAKAARQAEHDARYTPISELPEGWVAGRTKLVTLPDGRRRFVPIEPS